MEKLEQLWPLREGSAVFGGEFRVSQQCCEFFADGRIEGYDFASFNSNSSIANRPVGFSMNPVKEKP